MNRNAFMTLSVLSVVAVVILGSLARGKEKEEEGVIFIKREELRKAMKSERPPVLINVLGREGYLEKRIPGSISIPLNKVDELAKLVLPARNTEIVVYCASFLCRASTEAAKKLMAKGYTNVKDYEGGVEDWEKAKYPLDKGGAPKAEEKAKIRKVEANEVGREAICPVMGSKFKVQKGTDVAEYKGKTYSFCCPGCQGPFAKDPEKHTGKGD